MATHKSPELQGLRMQSGADAPCCITGSPARDETVSLGEIVLPADAALAPDICSREADGVTLHRAACVPHREQTSAPAAWCAKSGALPEVSADNQKIYGADAQHCSLEESNSSLGKCTWELDPKKQAGKVRIGFKTFKRSV